LLRHVIERGEANGFEIIAGLFPSHLKWNVPTGFTLLEEFLEADRSRPELRVAMGRFFTVQGRLVEALQMVEGVVQERPDDLRAAAALIACLREADATVEWNQRVGQLPATSVDEPWLLLLERGTHALRHGQPEQAITAYRSVVQKDRTNIQAWHGLLQATRAIGDDSQYSRATTMVTVLGKIQNQISRSMQQQADPNSFLDLADLCAKADLDREGAILSAFALQLDSGHERGRASLARFQSRPSTDDKTSPVENWNARPNQ